MRTLLIIAVAIILNGCASSARLEPQRISAGADPSLLSLERGYNAGVHRPILQDSTVTADAGCTQERAISHPEIVEPEIRQVIDRLKQLKPGMTKEQVWTILGNLPLDKKVLWVSAGSDWGEGNDSYRLNHGYSLRLLWNLTEYDWITGAYRVKLQGPYRRAWLYHERLGRIEF